MQVMTYIERILRYTTGDFKQNSENIRRSIILRKHTRHWAIPQKEIWCNFDAVVWYD